MSNNFKFKVGESIPLGQLDDKLLIETWNLALKEYNCFYSIDPSIRKQDSQDMEKVSRKISVTTTTNISASTKKRKRDGQNQGIIVNENEYFIQVSNNTSDLCAHDDDKAQRKVKLGSDDVIAKEEDVQIKNQDRLLKDDLDAVMPRKAIISSDLIAQVLFPECPSSCDAMTNQVKNIESESLNHSTLSPSDVQMKDEESLVESIAIAYQQGYNCHKENQIIDKLMIEEKATEMFPESYLLQSWFKTGAITAISFKS